MIRKRLRVPALLVPAIAALVAAGCASGGGSGTGAGPAPADSLEKTTLNVAVVPAMDSAGFFVALHQGLFAAAGLKINYTPATSSDTVIAGQMRGQYDITGGNYVSYIQAAAQRHDDLRIVAEGSVMQQGAQVIFTLPTSPIRSLAQLKGHVLGVNAPSNIEYLLSASVLTEHDISPSAVKFPVKPIPFPDMGQELASGKIAAVTLPEPFASLAEENLGAITLADLNQGATQQFPIEGYVVTRAWAARYPSTLAAFVKALEQGQQIADTSRPTVEQAFESLKGPQNGQVPPTIASVMALDTYPLGVDKPRLQRVADVMLQFGLLKHAFNVSQMLGG
ncbi:MAG: ABC transporter substrate-binding protein [Streptosporangiaceae bacterium]|nr:ABC transporter substrate-binding protein [Streptosporangiaceae bacterium]MBV9855300.1 ABC transporter substrate-binding protein [Streptosporangiaceae bacterium]